MNPWQTFRVAVSALRRNALRSSLTALGIVIGVAAVIAMVAIGEGAKARVEQSFAAMGTNLLVIIPGASKTGGARGGFGSASTLTWDDLEAIKELSSVASAAPTLRTTAQVMSDEQNWQTTILGTTPEYFEIRRWSASAGVVLQQSDIDARAKVAVIGQTVSDKLFGPGNDPLGHTIRIRNIPFNIIGVLAKKGQSPQGQDYDDSVHVPVTTYQAKVQGGLAKYLAGSILVAAQGAKEATARAERDVTNLLRDRHHITPPDEDDFWVRNLSEVASAQEEGTKTLTTLLASIALVSLLVGGIGVMNIMLVSVTERTREIGLRMAIGAKPRQILAQFLVEALTLATLGGILGVSLGLLVAQRLAASFGWPMLVRPDVIFIAVGFSAVVGVVFGAYPARRASQLNPIEALRYE